MAVQNALVGAGVPQNRPVEVTELGIDGGQSRHGVSLTENKQVLAAPGGVGDVDVQETTVEQGHQRNGGGERPSRVQALVHGVAALFQGEDPDVGILHRQQLKNARPEEIILAGHQMRAGDAPLFHRS